MRKKLKKLNMWLGRVLPDLRRHVSQPDESLERLLVLCERLHAQEKTESKKLYSLHEPEVMCISKGKAQKRYEFGHLKSDHRMQRCFLKGLIGDAINATLAAAGSNLL